MSSSFSSSFHINHGADVSARLSEIHAIDATELVLNSPELLLNIIRIITDGNCVQSIKILSLVSRNFYTATLSNRLWREMCYQRWRGKWGFHKRWEKALVDSGEYECSCNRKEVQPKNEHENFWKSRYKTEEEDATNPYITADELETLVFDFRFWLGQPILVDEDHIQFKSGLIESASQEFRFLRNTREREWSFLEDEGPWNAKGHIVGHPSNEVGIEWFLITSAAAIQWGVSPNLWPMGVVSRLENWGWQISNPNVVLRAIDPLGSQITLETTDWDGKRLCGTESKCQQCIRCHGKCTTECLWKDLLDSLQTIPLLRAMVRHGVRMTAEVPREVTRRFTLEFNGR